MHWGRIVATKRAKAVGWWVEGCEDYLEMVLTGKNKGNHSKNHLSIRGAKENNINRQSLHHNIQ